VVFRAEDGIRDFHVTGVQTCALPILVAAPLSLVVLQQLDSLGSEQLAPELVLGLLTVTAWLLAVVGGIFRHALDLPWPAALAIRSEERRGGKGSSWAWHAGVAGEVVI